nr:hypothetical protein [Lentzea californiensis]
MKTSPVDSTASEVTPRSTPTTVPGRVGAGSARVISTENEQNQRPDRQDTAADRIRAVPRSTCRASFRVDSQVRTVPMRGSVTCRRSSVRPNAPVVNRHDTPPRLPLNLGNRTGAPRRPPVREPCQFVSAVARLASPDEYASLEFSPHHGATSYLAWFQSLRRLYADHDTDAVH